jgi:hypothetical protein
MHTSGSSRLWQHRPSTTFRNEDFYLSNRWKLPGLGHISALNDSHKALNAGVHIIVKIEIRKSRRYEARANRNKSNVLA